MNHEQPETTTISIIIPAYNEEKRLPRYLARIFKYLAHNRNVVEVIVIDDGSTDGTSRAVNIMAEQHEQLVLHRIPRNRGKGNAVRTGMGLAKGNIRLFADADGATPIEEIERLLGQISQGADVAIGSRALHSYECTVNAKQHRKIIGSIFNLLVRLLTVKGLNDTQCGFKMFTARAADHTFPRQTIHRFGFDIELLYIARKAGFTIAEVPVNWSDVAGSKVSLVKDSIKMFLDLLAVRWNDFRGKYD